MPWPERRPCLVAEIGADAQAVPAGRAWSEGRPALSEFGLQLREKSKFKLAYGVDERNLRRLFGMRVRKGATGAKLMEFLERRLDNVVYPPWFRADAPRRAPARLQGPYRGERQESRFAGI